MITPRALLATSLTLMACVPAAAQTMQPTRPERPYRGIFASGVDNSGQSLTGNAVFSGGYDDNILAAARGGHTSLRNAQEGSFAQFSGGLNYAFNADRGTINAAAGTSQRYYPSLQDEYFDTYNASIGGTLKVSTRPNVTLHQSASYRPFTFLDTFPGTSDPIIGASDPTDADFVPIANQYFAFEGGADLQHQMSRRTTFTSSWNYIATDKQSNQFWRQSVGADIAFGMTRDLNLHLGYRYTQAHYGDRITEIHRPNIGLDFLHALSLTRRTSLTFGVGTEAVVYNDKTRFNVVGNANLTHEIGRSWTTGAAYQRGTFFVETLAEPMSGDAGSVHLNGLITRRIQFEALASGSMGQMGYSQSRHFDSYRGSVTLSTALNRFMNVGLDYAYYKYLFDSTVELEPGLPRDINRQSIRAHLSLWAPIYNKARRTNASR